MPHLIIEHSADISSKSIIHLQSEIQNIMALITEGNFDPDQCKCRAISFDQYLVGKINHEQSSFLHITIKILAGRTLEARQKLAKNVMEFAKKFYEEQEFSANLKDKIVEAGTQIADAITGLPYVPKPEQNTKLINKRCDISVDIIEMTKETYQKFRY